MLCSEKQVSNVYSTSFLLQRVRNLRPLDRSFMIAEETHHTIYQISRSLAPDCVFLRHWGFLGGIRITHFMAVNIQERRGGGHRQTEVTTSSVLVQGQYRYQS